MAQAEANRQLERVRKAEAKLQARSFAAGNVEIHWAEERDKLRAEIKRLLEALKSIDKLASRRFAEPAGKYGDTGCFVEIMTIAEAALAAAPEHDSNMEGPEPHSDTVRLDKLDKMIQQYRCLHLYWSPYEKEIEIVDGDTGDEFGIGADLQAAIDNLEES